MKPPLVLWAFLISLYAWTTDAASPPAAGSAQGGPFGKGARESEVHVSTVRDTAQISYPGSTENSGGARPSRLLMAKPERCEQEGIYIWRDAEGIWNICSVSSQGVHVTIDISAETDIEPVGDRAAAIKVSSPGKALINQTETAGVKPALFQFRANGKHVDFDFLINGKHEPERLFLGRQGWNPRSASFRMENRPLEVPEASREQTATTENVASKSNSSRGPTSSGGGGGGPPPK